MLVSKLNPVKVFKYFERISAIPHGSGNCSALSDYCMSVAREHGHEVFRDAYGNVMIFAKGSAGYEASEPVILQAHLDMVCDKLPESSINMNTDPLELNTDGEMVWAHETTLGADNGIAVAYILAILSDPSLQHPPIEILLTIDEEVGMQGAKNLDASHLKGKRLINLDTQDEGVFMVSCAGGIHSLLTYLYPREESVDSSQIFYSIAVSGLPGGHSGSYIHKRRLNAIKILAEIIEKLGQSYQFSIPCIEGGSKDNAIPTDAKAVICMKKTDLLPVCEIFEKLVQDIIEKYGEKAKNMKVAFAPAPREKVTCSHEQTMGLARFLLALPDSVWKMSENMPDKVESSMNLGVIQRKGGAIRLEYLLRSNTAQGKDDMMNALTATAREYGADITFLSGYNAWEYQKESPLRDTMLQIYRRLYQEEAKLDSIHASLECGILSGKLPDADIISMGPTVYYVHTPKETMEVASVARSWEFLLEVLKELK